MKTPIVRILIAGMICLWAQSASLGAATVRLIDQTTVRGDLISLADGKLTVNRRGTTQPATRMSIDLTDIAQVVLREPSARAAQHPASEGQQSILGTLGSIFGGSSPSDSDASEQPEQTVTPSPAAAEAPPQATSRPASAIDWLMMLKSGDALHGHLSQWAEQKLTMNLDASPGQMLEVPGNQLLELWCGADALLKKAAAMKIDAGAYDVVFVEKAGNVVTVKGSAIGVAGDALRFRMGDEERKIALARLVGIVFASGTTAGQSESFRQAMRLSSGDVMTGAWTGMDRKALTVRSAWGATIKLPVNQVNSIDFLGGRIEYLSDLKPVKVEQTPFFGRVIPFRVDRSLEGGPLKLSDGTYARGIAVHSRCLLQFDIQRNFDRFQTTLGFEDPQGKTGSVSARVLGDGKTLYENPEARGDQKPIQIDVDVTGMQALTLEVDFGKGQDAGDRVIWANARLLRARRRNENSFSIDCRDLARVAICRRASPDHPTRGSGFRIA